jgi:hypothetical protein
MSEPRREDRPIEPDAGAAEPATVARPAGRLVIWGVNAAVIGIFLVLDFFTPYAMRPGINWWVFVLLGICIGQVDLIATWAVLAPGNLVVRLPWSLLLAMAMWYALVLGNRVWRFIAIENALLLGAVLLAGATIAQVPLWIAKRAFRWRLIRGPCDPVQADQGPWQFNLQHLFLATFLWAVALAPLRHVLPPGPIGHLPHDPELPVLLPAVIVCNLLVTVPCIWGALVLRRSMAPLAVGWLFYCGLLTCGEFAVLSAIFRHSPNAEAGFRIFVVNLYQCATVFGTLLIYRALGFRLVRARPPEKTLLAQSTAEATRP